MPRVVVIADDLTGACDSTAPFAPHGARTVVDLRWDATRAAAADVLGYTTDSRALSPDRAVAVVRSLGDVLRAAPSQLIVKKIDSTLLGNIPHETQALMEMLGRKMGAIAPAFPRMGRCFIDGTLHLAGAKTDRTLPDLMASHDGAACPVVSLATVRLGPDSLLQQIHQYETDGFRWCAIDSERDEDLEVVAQAMDRLSGSVLPVVSGGLMQVLARRASTEGAFSRSTTAEAGVRLYGPKAGTVVIFVGSNNAHTEQQIVHLAEKCPVRRMAVQDASAEELAAHGGTGRIAVVRVGWSDADVRALGRTLEGARDGIFAGVLMTGGDTARLVCRVAQCSYLSLVGEVTTGLPYGRFGDGLLANVPFVTKAGGFGALPALWDACQHVVSVGCQP